ncbi:hypothetical protein F9C28_17620 [Shimwellia pseudoproteus]|nr:hypothetical protein [Shimwellia pseudoproteus]
MGLRKVKSQFTGSLLIGALVMLMADWLGKVRISRSFLPKLTR